jgi:hypothetical protein
VRAAFALLTVLSALLLAGCPRNGSNEPATSTSPLPGLNQDRSAGAFAQTDPWLLTTTDPNANRGNHGVFLGNGYLGATFGPNGGAGKNSVAFIAGLYELNETLTPIRNWHDLGLPEPKAGQPYSQTLDMKRGVLITKMGGVTISSLVSAVAP